MSKKGLYEKFRKLLFNRKIDALIYNLYNLNDNEIKIIENSFK